MKILVTNDDGIDAPGIAALIDAIAEFGEPIVAAPSQQLSGCSHRVTADGGVRIEQRGHNRFAIEGTPADCVRLGLYKLAPGADWVVSGINAGGNIGVDVHLSGTVAAVREAALHGVPGIAFSYYRARGHRFEWRRASDWTRDVFKQLLEHEVDRSHFWNVNFPSLPADAAMPEIVLCPVDANPLPLNYRLDGDLHHYATDYHERPRQPGSDMDVCSKGRIALSRIGCGFVHHAIHGEGEAGRNGQRLPPDPT